MLPGVLRRLGSINSSTVNGTISTASPQCIVTDRVMLSSTNRHILVLSDGRDIRKGGRASGHPINAMPMSNMYHSSTAATTFNGETLIDAEGKKIGRATPTVASFLKTSTPLLSNHTREVPTETETNPSHRPGPGNENTGKPFELSRNQVLALAVIAGSILEFVSSKFRRKRGPPLRLEDRECMCGIISIQNVAQMLFIEGLLPALGTIPFMHRVVTEQNEVKHRFQLLDNIVIDEIKTVTQKPETGEEQITYLQDLLKFLEAKNNENIVPSARARYRSQEDFVRTMTENLRKLIVEASLSPNFCHPARFTGVPVFDLVDAYKAEEAVHASHADTVLFKGMLEALREARSGGGEDMVWTKGGDANNGWSDGKGHGRGGSKGNYDEFNDARFNVSSGTTAIDTTHLDKPLDQGFLDERDRMFNELEVALSTCVRNCRQAQVTAHKKADEYVAAENGLYKP